MSTPTEPVGPVLLPRDRHAPPAAPPPEMPEDTSSQALADALRSSFAIIKIIMLLLLVVFLASGMRTVGPQEKAIILRLGKPVGEGEKALLGPGLHWAFPPPIDEVVRIPIAQVQTASSTIGWYQTTAAQKAADNEPAPTESLNPLTDGYVLTADGNIIHVTATLRYRIREPGLRYTFDFSNASNLVQNALNNALVFAAAHYRVDNALTRDVVGFREKVRLRLDDLIAQQGLGILIDQIEAAAIPPRQLTPHFRAVLEAEVNRGKVINDARSFANQTTSQAKAEAAARITAGETDRARLVEFVAAEAKRFLDLLPEYRRDPQLFTRLHQAEVLQRVVARAQEKWVTPLRANGTPPAVRLQLTREPQKLKTVEPAREEH